MPIIKNICKYSIYILLFIFVVVFGLNLAGFNFGRVVSNSMMPCLSKDDLVLINPYRTPKVGDIIVFNDNAGIIIHRLLRIVKTDDKTYYLCAGDNNKFFAMIDGESINLQNINERINFLNSLSVDEALNVAENVVEQQNYTGTAIIRFSKLGVIAKLIFGNKLTVVVLLCFLILIYKNENKMIKNTYFN